jgi:RNA polymerase sigma-70 factor (ECF subfamily)
MLDATLPLPDTSALTDVTVPAADHGALSDPLAALARRAARGDVQAFEALYRAEHRRIYAAVWRLVGGHEARAEELTQDAFVRAWRSLPGFRFEAPVGAWLHRLAVNTALMDLRARRDAEDLEVDDSTLSLQAAPRQAQEHQIDLQAAILKLPSRARAVLVLHDIEGLTHEEIGESLGIAPGSCKAHLHRARQHLRRALGDTA